MKILSVILVSTICLSFCLQIVQAQSGVKGNGVIKKETRDVSGFTGVSVGGAFNVFLEKGNNYKLIVEADENLLDIIETYREGNTLIIKTSKNMRDAKKLDIYVTMKELDHLKVSGAADVKSKSKFSSRKMTIDASGAADIELEINAEAMVCNQSGSSDVSVSGTVGQIGVSLSGSSDFKGADLKADTGKIHASGSSSARVYLTEAIEADASGSSNITCSGNPSQTKLETSGSADIHLN